MLAKKCARALVSPIMAMDNLLPLLLLDFLLYPGLFLLLHLTGLMLALAYWRRCPGACSLLLMASLLNLMPFVLPDADLPISDGPLSISRVFTWAAYGLMLLAIFAGRKESKRPSVLPPDDDWRPPVSPTTGDDRTGIHQRRG